MYIGFLRHILYILEKCVTIDIVLYFITREHSSQVMERHGHYYEYFGCT